MKINKILICDLTHTAQTISSEFMPYGQACIASYLKFHIHYPVEVNVIKFLRELEDEIRKCPPDIIGFSHYIWNADLSLKVASIIKSLYPKTVIIFGGPNFPVEIDKQKEWLKKNRQVDFFVRLEGEKPFCNLVASIIENDKDLDKVKRSAIKSTSSYDGESFYIYPTDERISNLEEIPSPYLKGILDKYLETSLWPITETNRGCPFQCAFCTEGYSYFNRVAKRDKGSIREEMLYIAKRHKNNSMLFIADSNFLMYKDDLEVCEILNYTQKRYNWPTFIGCSTGKNKKDIILKGAGLLSGRITVAASVQSLDEVVLKNINRSNISQSQLILMAKDVQDSGGISYSELIACLPGDTLESHFESMKNLVSSGISIIKHHVLLLIEGAPLSSKESRKKFGFKSMWRVVTKSFGNYSFLDSNFNSIEFEEVVVETDTLSFSDYLSCRKLGLVIHYFYNDSLFEEVHKLLMHFQVPIWDWLLSIYKNIDFADNSLKRLHDGYLFEVKDELWLSKEELLRDIDRYIPEFLSGKRGNNITFKYRALLLKEGQHIRDAFEFGFSQMEKILTEKYNIDIKRCRGFFMQLKELCILRKGEVFNTDKDITKRFDFDFEKIYSLKFSDDVFSKIDGGVQIEIAHTKEQKDFINEYFNIHQKEKIVDIASLLNRVPAETMYRKISIKDKLIKKDKRICHQDISL